MLLAAEQRDRLQGDLAAINERLRDAPVRESADPQVEAIARALAFAGLTIEPRDAGYALTLIFALAIELMAAFGAGWCGVHLPAHREAAQTTKAAQPGHASPLPSTGAGGRPYRPR